MNESSKYRRQHCLKTLFLLFKFVTRKTNGYFVTRANALLVSKFKIIKIATGDVSLSIALQDGLNSAW